MALKRSGPENKKTRAPHGGGLIGIQQKKLVPVIEATGQPADGKTPFEKPPPV
jgi:hypothetical protein